MGADYKQLQALQKQIEQLQKFDFDAFVRDATNEIAQRFYAKVVKRTPVGQYPAGSGKVGGTLRRGWRMTQVKEVADGYEEIGCEVEVTDNSAKFTKSRVYDTFSVEASCDKSFFDAESLVKYSAAADKAGNAFQSFLKVLPFILAVIAVALILPIAFSVISMIAG